jgi:transposase
MERPAEAAVAGAQPVVDGLSALVEQQLGGHLLKGDVFLFVGRSWRRAKVLYFDGTGLVLMTKRLFQGRFARPWADKGARSVELTEEKTLAVGPAS